MAKGLKAERAKRRSAVNKESEAARLKCWHAENKERVRFRNAARYREKQAVLRAQVKAYRDSPEGKIVLARASSKYGRRPDVVERRREKDRRKQRSPHETLYRNFSRNVRQALKGRKSGRKWEAVVGYTLLDLTLHLEKQFTKPMTWANYGVAWHVDHIRPVSSFSFESASDQAFLDCWALSNLRPLSAKENLVKNAKRIFLL